MSSNRKIFLRALAGKNPVPPPIWLMRQAGRYLPEYRETRAKVDSFLDLCFTPELAVEVTLQPIRRYGFDAAILFADILVTPHALGQKVWFEEGTGPRLEAIHNHAGMAGLSLSSLHQTLGPVYETLRQLRRELPPETALIGFAGAPWTVTSYMIEGGSSRDFAKAKAWAREDEAGFAELIGLLVEATAEYLIAQADAGAEALQIFDSWASAWEGPELRRWCLEPTAEIVQRVKTAHPRVPVILFPRAVGDAYGDFAREAGADGLSLDPSVPLAWARETLQPSVTLQGNLDPQVLVRGGVELREAVDGILRELAGGPFVFNLGHGIVPETPPEHVTALVEQVRAWKP